MHKCEKKQRYECYLNNWGEGEAIQQSVIISYQIIVYL